jgi:hypothetical protein
MCQFDSIEMIPKTPSHDGLPNAAILDNKFRIRLGTEQLGIGRRGCGKPAETQESLGEKVTSIQHTG